MPVAIDIRLDTQDMARFDRQIRALLTTLSPHYRAEFLRNEVRPYLIGRTHQRFDTESNSGTGRWAPLRPRTQKIRRWLSSMFGLPIGPAHPINVRTGALKQFVTSSFDVTNTPNTTTLRMPGITGGNEELIRKLTHAQKGGKAPGGSAYGPRPVLSIDALDARVITDSAHSWITKMLVELQ